ncbi:MAG: hypothetical protein N2557_05875 [Hydrogenophilus sp.]|nr:hypothetical protein [Hydrogenophilus sp.]
MTAAAQSTSTTVPWLPPLTLTIDLTTAQTTLTAHPPGTITGPIEHGWRTYQQHGPAAFTLGVGRLADSPLAGTRRLFVCGYSHAWESFYISSLGGAGYIFKHLGIPWVTLLGRAPQPALLLLLHNGTQPTAHLHPFPDHLDLWRRGYPHPSTGEPLAGAFAIQQALLDRYGNLYPEKHIRILAVGPAAAYTWEGAILSNPVEKRAITPVTDLCGRGGMGSTLYRDFNIVAILFGGHWQPALKETTKTYDPDFQERFGDRFVKVEQRATLKYSLDPKTGTGGTFGSNYAAMGDKLLSFNYQSVFAPKAQRLQQQHSFILGHFWKQFQEETILPKNFEHCGEPCSVACKKMRGPYKKDYEPYHTLGPQIGIFDQRAAERLNAHADAMGFDAIQLGGLLAWLFEAIAVGDLDPQELGLPPRTHLRFPGFTADPTCFDLTLDSAANADYAIAAIDAILWDQRAAPLRDGIRVAAHTLNQRHPTTRPGDRAVYLAHGERGSMVPNQYFVMGMFSPMPIMGKYYVFYGPDLLSPEELGRWNVARMIGELLSDNAGMCRFHRQWGEAIIGELLARHRELPPNYRARVTRLAAEIFAAEEAASRFWETPRMIELFAHYWRWQRENGVDLTPVAAFFAPEAQPGETTAATIDRLLAANDFDRWRQIAERYWNIVREAQKAAIAEALAQCSSSS